MQDAENNYFFIPTTNMLKNSTTFKNGLINMFAYKNSLRFAGHKIANKRVIKAKILNTSTKKAQILIFKKLPGTDQPQKLLEDFA